MDVNKILNIALLMICLESYSEGAIFTGVALAGLSSALVGVGIWTKCRFKECCNKHWTRPVIDSKEIFERLFQTKIFGQHLVLKVVPKAVYNHIHAKNPKKALVMSFHGGPGSGKNYVSQLIAEFIYKEGLKSEYVHLRIASQHYPDSQKVDEYREELKEFITKSTKQCEHSLFIFDEMDKMPAGVTDALKHFIDYHHVIDGVDYRKSIYIFLNNIGSDRISQVVHHFFSGGYAREDITTKRMEDVLSINSLKKGGLKDSNLILCGLIDFFVPFLPMERYHVKQCINAEIENSELTSTLSREERTNIIENVVKELQFYPPNEEIFAVDGCKKVSKKLEIFL